MPARTGPKPCRTIMKHLIRSCLLGFSLTSFPLLTMAQTEAGASRPLPPQLPAITNQYPAAVADAKGIPSLAQIEAKIRELDETGIALSSSYRFNQWQKFVEAIPPADLPRALDVLERTGTKNTRNQLRGCLLASLAETDPGAAMAHANALPDKAARELVDYSRARCPLQGLSYAGDESRDAPPFVPSFG